MNKVNLRVLSNRKLEIFSNKATKMLKIRPNHRMIKIEPPLGGLTEEQINVAKAEATKQKIPLHKCIYNLGFIDEKSFLQAIAEKADIDYIDLNTKSIPEKALKVISANVASHYNIMPVKIIDKTLFLATSDPLFNQIKREIELVLDNVHDVEFVLASSESIKKAIRKSYGLGAATVEQMTNIQAMEEKDSQKEDLIEQAEARDASVIHLVNQLLADAISAGATDIHIEPYENELKTRYRIDGMLHDAGIPQTFRFFKEGITSRIKIISGLDIAEKRLPQDGRSQVTLGGHKFDLRISILPTRFGESIDIRILPQSKLISDLSSLGIDEQEEKALLEIITKPHGIILLTGPTGSGKTTTLYTCMYILKKNTTKKIITIEDPIEYDMNGIVQMQVHPDIGFTFAKALRSMLRHDPDIMLVGEIRDLETAEIAIRSALTGHLVFSTLHTNNAVSAITRLLDMGIEPFLAASSIDAILGQRLVRVICQNCKEPKEPEMVTAIKSMTKESGPITFYHGRGCAKCRFTGYKERTVITELLVLSDKIREMTVAKKHSNEIDAQARMEGMTSLFHSGLDKVKKGITTCEEVLRVTKGNVLIDESI
jgi:type II secretory ATPase GspE/PulE/Tfp pilus assembly ATPase PilB-like protein